MALIDDISIAVNGDIRYIGAAHGEEGAGYYTVLELYRFLQEKAAESMASGDDILDINYPIPANKQYDTIITLINGYNIDDTLSEHTYGGSIIQDDGDTIYDGFVNFGTEGIHIELIQNGAIIANDFWNTIPFGSTSKGLNPDVAAGKSHRFMVKTRTAGAYIDGQRIYGINREFGYSYGEFFVNGTSRGENVLALTHSADLNNQTAEGTVATWTEITNTEGYNAIDVDGNGTNEYYYSKWNRDVYTANQFFERIKWLARRGSASTLYGLNGNLFRGITHEITVDNPSATDFSAVEEVTWPTGSGQMLAINDVNAPTKMWIQLLSGVAPVNNQQITGETSGATCDVDTTVTERTITIAGTSPLQSTGSAIIGAYGFGIEASDLSAADKLFDLTNTQKIPPNNVTFTVYGVVSGEDQVLVTPTTGTGIQYDQLSGDGAYSGGEATFVVQEAIPGDTPTSGTIRVWNGETYSRVTYTGWSVSSFTGCSGLPACSNGVDCYISYIDKTADGTSVSFTGVYQSNRNLWIIVRDGGASPIKPFETSGVLTSAGGTATAIRTSDA
jgi:hypothetical protein